MIVIALMKVGSFITVLVYLQAHKNFFCFIRSVGIGEQRRNLVLHAQLPMDLLTVLTYEEIAATNLFGAIDVTMTFLPLVKKARGRVVNVSSMLGRFTLPLTELYCISKYGLEAFSDGLR